MGCQIPDNPRHTENNTKKGAIRPQINCKGCALSLKNGDIDRCEIITLEYFIYGGAMDVRRKNPRGFKRTEGKLEKYQRSQGAGNSDPNDIGR